MRFFSRLNQNLCNKYLIYLLLLLDLLLNDVIILRRERDNSMMRSSIENIQNYKYNTHISPTLAMKMCSIGYIRFSSYTYRLRGV